jgi:SAM-dependent methyltransferase
MVKLQQGKYIDRYLTLVAHRPGGRVLDIGCGPGWLALELGRRGQIVDAYDISPQAIALAQQMLDENPYKKGFGEVHYYLKDVSQEELGENTYDAISGWSAFHHMPDFPEFMQKIDRALKPGGIIATMDDYPRRRREINVTRFWGLVLPTTERSYRDKFLAAWNRFAGRTVDSPEIFSPMEEAKYSTVEDIHDIWYNRYQVIANYPFNAFAGSVMQLLAGPDWFRYSTAQVLNKIDELGIHTGVFQAQCRIIISRKRK